MFKKILILGAVVLSGCVALPTAQEAALADHGEYPTNYEEIVKNYFDGVAKDPDSLKYRGISTPQKYWLGDRLEGARYGYLVCATVNGKNSYGAYVGYKTDGLLIRNGSVILVVPNGDWWGRKIC